MPNLPSGAGQTDKAHSLSVVMASDADGGGGTTTIDTTVLAKEAKQDTGNATLTSIDGHVDGLEASATSIDGKLTGVATAAAQATGNTSIGNIDTKIGAAVSGDGQAAGTIGSLFSRLLLWNGATYDRARTAVTAISSTLTGFLNTLPWATYHLTPTTRADGQSGPLETDASGSLRVNVAASVELASLTSIDGKLTAQKGPQKNANLYSINVTSITPGTPTIKTLSSTDVGTAVAAGAEFVFTAEGGDIWWYADSATSGQTIVPTDQSLSAGVTIADYIPSGQSTGPMVLAAACATGSIVAIGSNALAVLRIRKVN